MKRWFYIIMLLAFTSGCVFLGRSLNVQVGRNYDSLAHDSYAILPFIDKRVVKQTLGYNTADAMTDAFETAFIGTGLKVVDRQNIDKALNELEFSYKGDVDPDQRRQIGKLTNSDVIIVGKLRTFHNALFQNKKEPEKPSKCTSISYSVKAIHIESGEILWKGSFIKSTGIKDDFLYSCECEVLQYANKAASDLVEKIVKKTKAGKE